MISPWLRLGEGKIISPNYYFPYMYIKQKGLLLDQKQPFGDQNGFCLEEGFDEVIEENEGHEGKQNDHAYFLGVLQELVGGLAAGDHL